MFPSTAKAFAFVLIIANVPSGAVTPTRHTGDCISVDGKWGDDTKKRFQEFLGVEADGDFGSNSVKAMQTFLNEKRAGLDVDGDFGSDTTKALQTWISDSCCTTWVDGKFEEATIEALQRFLNINDDSCDSSAVKRVAFVGNSYTHYNDLPSMFASLCDSAGIYIDHDQVTPDGNSLSQHADLSGEVGKQTQDMLKHDLGWDYIILQDQSQNPGGGQNSDEDLAPGVGFDSSIDALKTFYAPLLAAANATAVLYSTWGRHDGDPENAKCCNYGSFLSMNAATTAGYERYARELSPVLIAPGGRGFELVYNATVDPLADGLFSCLYNHDAGNSCVLNAAGDGGHPSELGTYLISCIMFGTIHGRTPKDLAWAPDSISAELKKQMQTVAHEAVFTLV
jgi:hypothetical protein